MSDLGKRLREARVAAGLSLSGMSRRTGYSSRYLGNVETGVRRATPAIARAYERVLGDNLNRRMVLVGLVSGLTMTSAEPDIAVDVFRDIAAERSGSLATAQTSHETDKMISYLVGNDLGSVAVLSAWAVKGRPVLRVNSIGILAKLGSAAIDNDVVSALRVDLDARTLYLTAVASRVLGLPWDDAAWLVKHDGPLEDPAHLRALRAEVGNMTDSGARWCSMILLARLRPAYPQEVDQALAAALRSETSRENLRTIGCVLAGMNPLEA